MTVSLWTVIPSFTTTKQYWKQRSNLSSAKKQLLLYDKNLKNILNYDRIEGLYSFVTTALFLISVVIFATVLREAKSVKTSVWQSVKTALVTIFFFSQFYRSNTGIIRQWHYHLVIKLVNCLQKIIYFLPTIANNWKYIQSCCQ